jgi:aryl-alcohol dehydrogenase-like predicted oxidoreductase
MQRPLGSTGFRVAPLAFGGNVFGWSADQATSFRLLDAFVDAGFNLVDTADMYSIWAPGHRGGESETIIGAWLAANPGKRRRVVIATKCGMDMQPPRSPGLAAPRGGASAASQRPGAADGPDRKGLSRRWIHQACHDSLQRLGVDHIDLYQAHRDDPDTPLDETLSAFDELVKAGKVRAIGASNYTAARLKEALDTSTRLGVARYATLQPEYNLMERAGFEAELQPLCAREGISVINFFGLARGFLTGKYRSEADLGKSATRGGGVRKYLDDRGMRVLAALDAVAKERGAVAKERGATPAQVALAWNMARPTIAAPIASATSVAQLQELMQAATTTLHDDDMRRLDAASSDRA